MKKNTKCEVIKRLRLQLNMSQTEFGNAIGRSKQSVCSYEKGRKWPSLIVCEKIMFLAQENLIYLNINDFICIK